MACLQVLVACSPVVPPPAAPAPSGPTGPGTSSATSDSATPASPADLPPGPLPVASVEVRTGELVVAVPVGTPGRHAPVAVEPGATFDIRVSAPLQDARLVLLDAQDAIVPSTGGADVDAGTRFHLAPSEPLRAAGRYLLRIEGLENRMVRSTAGQRFEPFALLLVVSGEPPPRAPPKKGATKRRR